MPVVLAAGFLAKFVFGTFFILSSLFLILLVLVQRGKGGGLTGALGGMGGQSAFGAKAGDVFTRVTLITAGVWIVMAWAGAKAFQASADKAILKDDSPKTKQTDGDKKLSGMKKGGTGVGAVGEDSADKSDDAKTEEEKSTDGDKAKAEGEKTETEGDKTETEGDKTETEKTETPADDAETSTPEKSESSQGEPEKTESEPAESTDSK